MAEVSRALNIVGCGRVGRTLARLWHESACFEIGDVLSPRSAAAAVDFIGGGRAVDSMQGLRTADVWMIATPDAAIEAAACEIALQNHAPATVFHCSGFHSSTLLRALIDRGWHAASVHPAMSFADPASALAQFAGTPCGIEGDAAAEVLLRQAFEEIGARCFDLSPQQKPLYHAAAVFSSNFVPVLQAIAIELWRSTEVPASLHADLTQALLEKAARNVVCMGPANALTGPAARGDQAVVREQFAALEAWNPSIAAAYRQLSELASQLAKQGDLKPQVPQSS